jgi:hypothetical protein
MHRVSIHKKLSHCLTAYHKTKFLLFQGSEGRQRVAEFRNLLQRYGDGTDDDLKPIYHFYLKQGDGSLLRNLIKSTLCEILDIPLHESQYLYSSFRNPYIDSEDIYKLIQDRKLTDRLEYLLFGLNLEMEMQPIQQFNTRAR